MTLLYMMYRFGCKFRLCWEDPDGELLNNNADADALMLWLSLYTLLVTNDSCMSMVI